MDLPLAPRELKVSVIAPSGGTVDFFLTPPPPSAIRRLTMGTISLDDFEPDQEKAEGAAAEAAKAEAPGETDGDGPVPAGPARKRRRPRRSMDLTLEDADNREVVSLCYIRAQETEGGKPLRIGGEPFDPDNDDHWRSIPSTWVMQIMAELTQFLMRMPRKLEKNSNSPAEHSPETTTSSGSSTGGRNASSRRTSRSKASAKRRSS